jgi:hypothetical protein
MECRTQDEIAEAVGFSRQAIGEFLNSLQDARNGTGAESSDLSENPQLTSEADREFDEDETEDSNSLGVYKLDKRLLIKANHLDEHFAPPIYNVWKQQSKTVGVNHFGNSEVRRLSLPRRRVASHKVGNRRLFGVGFVGIPGRRVDHEFQRLKQPRQLFSSGGRYRLAVKVVSPTHGWPS